MPIADLSIDFDFFAREDPLWDWGHSETRTISDSIIWNIRYGHSSFNLYDETNIDDHADFNPTDIVSKLMSKGVNLHTKRYQYRRIGVAESHKEAFDFFTARKYNKPPDYLINIDAHHDIFGDLNMPLNCGNWVTHLHNHWPDTNLIQVYPKWKTNYETLECPWIEEKQEPHTPINITTWDKWLPVPNLTIREIFICRSGAWVPPHMDDDFIKMVFSLSGLSLRTPTVIGSLLDRSDHVPSYEEHKEQVSHHNEFMKDFHNQFNRSTKEKVHV